MSLRLCPTGKWAFFDAKDAWRRLTEIRNTTTRQCVPCRIYKCDECGMWHLTSRHARKEVKAK